MMEHVRDTEPAHPRSEIYAGRATFEKCTNEPRKSFAARPNACKVMASYVAIFSLKRYGAPPCFGALDIRR